MWNNDGEKELDIEITEDMAERLENTVTLHQLPDLERPLLEKPDLLFYYSPTEV